MRSWSLIFVVCTVAMLSGRGLVYSVNSTVAGKSHTPKPENYFSREQIHRGRTYRNENRIAFTFGVLIRLSAMAILLATGLGGLLRDRLSQICGHRPVLTASLLLSAILILNSAISFPVSLYSGYFHEHTYGMSTQGLAGWFLDYGKSFLVHLVVIVPIGLGSPDTDPAISSNLVAFGLVGIRGCLNPAGSPGSACDRPALPLV